MWGYARRGHLHSFSGYFRSLFPPCQIFTGNTEINHTTKQIHTGTFVVVGVSAFLLNLNDIMASVTLS